MGHFEHRNLFLHAHEFYFVAQLCKNYLMCGCGYPHKVHNLTCVSFFAVCHKFSIVAVGGGSQSEVWAIDISNHFFSVVVNKSRCHRCLIQPQLTPHVLSSVIFSFHPLLAAHKKIISSAIGCVLPTPSVVVGVGVVGDVSPQSLHRLVPWILIQETRCFYDTVGTDDSAKVVSCQSKQ